MLKNYFKIAFRNIKKNKWISALNITGLALGFSVSLLMLTYVIYENSFDNFQENGENTYRIAVEWGGGNSKMKFACAMPGISTDVRGKLPEVINACKMQAGTGKVELPNKMKKRENDFYFAEPQVLQMFTLKFMKGDKLTALKNPLSIIISESMAQKYFGNSEAIGKSINYNNYQMTITGIFQDLPKNTHLPMNMIASYSSLKAMGIVNDNPWARWGQDLVYVQLRKDASIADFTKKLHSMLSASVNETFSKRVKFVLRNFPQIHWYYDGYGDTGAKGKKLFVYIFLAASLLVMLIACFNFMNLSTSKFNDKFKEVGIRKVIGAQRIQLGYQFMVESSLVVLTALIFGVLIFFLLNKTIYHFLGTEVILYDNQFLSFGLLIAAFILIVGLFAGSYPAWFLSGLNPVNAIGKKFVRGDKLSFRSISTVLQFSFSILLIFSVLVIGKQLKFVETSDIGISKDNVIMIFPSSGAIPSESKYEVFKNELEKNPNINSVTGAYTLPGINSRSQISIRRVDDPENETREIQLFPVDYNYSEALGIKLLKGRSFSKNFSEDANSNVIINESAAKKLGFKNPVGKKIIQPMNNGNKELTIIGVVKDFHLYSFRTEISPLMLVINSNLYSIYAVKVSKDNQQETLSYIKNIYAKVFPEKVFKYRFISDAYRDLYISEEKTLSVISIFTLMTLLITSIGIIGIVSYITAQKTKEIGIRKVVGASIFSILKMIYKKFFLWIALSFLLFLPTGYYFLKLWLEQYAYKGNLGIEIYLIPLALIAVVTFLTISYKVIKAATANPIESLKYE